jgi:hypothetical protein
MRRRPWVYTPTVTNQTMMTPMSAWRALVRTVRKGLVAGSLDDAPPLSPPVSWGRIGGYEAVSRSGVLFLLDPEPAHPSLRATNTG